MEGKCPNCGWFPEFPEEDDEITWAHTPTSYENRWDALKKLRIREEYENQERESKGKKSTKFSKG